MGSERKKVLILSVKAGAGHLRAAAAMEQVLKETHPEVETHNVEALEYTNPAFQASFTSAYNKLASDLPSVWGILYEQMNKKSSVKSKKFAALVDRLNAAPIVRMVRRHAPDAIICTHYLPGEILGPLRRKGKLAAPLFVTLTDYDIHAMWIQEGVDRYFVATDEMAHALRETGIGSAKVSVTGIPIMPVFSQPQLAPRAMRLKLGLRAEPPTVLLSAGGFGLKRVDETVAMLADAVDDVQLVALAGRNEKLEKALRAVAAARPGKIVPMGFAANMHELMAASDFVVSKSGGLTCSRMPGDGSPDGDLQPHPGPGRAQRGLPARERRGAPRQFLRAPGLQGAPPADRAGPSRPHEKRHAAGRPPARGVRDRRDRPQLHLRSLTTKGTKDGFESDKFLGLSSCPSCPSW